MDTNNDRIYFDRYVYKTLKGWVSVGDERVKFEIAIPNFQRLLRLNLNINRVADKLELKLVDADYKIKKIFYENAGKCE